MNKLKIAGMLLLLMIAASQLAFSQENYVPGYVIKNDADTLFGFVDYRNWEKNPNKITFKTQLEGNPISFTPTDITEFNAGGEIYVSAIVDTETSPIQLDRLTKDAQPKIRVDTTFLQTLFNGKKSLYYYKNAEERVNFYIRKNSKFDLLVHKKYIKDIRKQDGKYIIAENRKYLGQLILYLNDCNTISSKLKSTSYDTRSLTKLFQYYYKCSQSEASFQKKLEKGRLEIGALAGASLTFLNFRSEVFPDLTNSKYSPAADISAGIFFDFVLPRNQGKWSFNNEILFSTYKARGIYEVQTGISSSRRVSTEIGYSYLKMNNLARFKYPIGNLFLFSNIGISNGFAISERANYQKRELIFSSTGNRIVSDGVVLEDTRKHEFGLLFGIGVKYDRFSFETRCEAGNGMALYEQLRSPTTRAYFLLGYRF